MASLRDVGWALAAMLLVLCYGHSDWTRDIDRYGMDSPEDDKWHIHDEDFERKLNKFYEEDEFGHDVNPLGETLLHLAAFFGKSEMVIDLIQKGADIRARDDFGKTPLHAAVFGGRRKIARYLLASGADINAQDGNGSTPLHLAVSIKFPEMVGDLLDSTTSINVNLFDTDLMTPLHLAVAAGESYITSLIVEKARVDLQSGAEGLTAFHLAVINHDVNIINALSTKGANINAQTFNGSTSLHLSIARGDETVTKVLLDMEDIMLNLKNDEGQSPLRLAEQLENQVMITLLGRKQANINSRFIDAANKGDSEVVGSLIHCGAELDTRIGTNGTALHVAASNGHLNVVKLLLDAGLYVDIRTLEGITALHVAVQEGHQPVVEYLTREGADINARDNSGMTVLHKASGNADLVKYFVKLKSNVNARDDRGWTPLHYSISAKNFDAFNELVRSDEEYDKEMRQNLDLNPYTSELVTPLHLAVKTDQPDIVEALAKRGAQLERPGKDGLTAFHYSAFSSNLPIMTVLDHQGANINAKTSNRSTALHLVVAQRNLDSVTHLLGMKRIKLNVVDDEGQTPLQLAERLGYDEIAERILEKGAPTDSRMIKAADDGEMAVVESLIEDGAHINSTDVYGETALHKAARNGHVDVVRYLLQKGAYMYAQQHSGYTPLTQAADSGQVEVVKLMVERGAEITSKDVSGMALLHWAAHGGNANLVEFLVDCGAKIDEVDDDGETPLHKAAWMGWLGVVKYLGGLKANVNAQRNNGETPLHWAACNGYTSIAKYLVIERLAKLSITNKHGETALDCAVRKAHNDTVKFFRDYSKLLQDSEGENLELVKCRVDEGADSKPDGDTALHKAAKNGNLRMVQYLVSVGVNVSSTNSQGDTPLVAAEIHGQVNVVRWLLDNEADKSGWQNDSQRNKVLFRVADSGCPGSADVVEIMISHGADGLSTDDNGMNILHWAAHGGNAELIRKLLDQEARLENYEGLIDAKDSSGQSPLQVAARMGNLDAVIALVDDHADVESSDDEGETALHKAAEIGNSDVVRYLLDNGANISSVDNQGETPLHKAACHGDPHIIEVLIHYGADFTARQNDIHRTTPVFTAANCGQLEAVKYFVSHPAGFANVQDTDNTGMSLLHWAAEGGNSSLVQYLIDNDVPINGQDDSGETPLHKASWMGQIDAAELLLENGADVNARRNDGNTALHWAACTNHMELARCLIGYGADMTITNNDGETPEDMARRKGNLSLAE